MHRLEKVREEERTADNCPLQISEKVNEWPEGGYLRKEIQYEW